MNRPTLVLLVLFLSGCTASLKDYQQRTPAFALDEYLSGHLVAWGMVQDYSNEMTRHFCVVIHGQWQQDGDVHRGVIDEQFYFDDGEHTTRVWELIRREEQGKITYTGTAGDVIGEAQGAESGNAFHWQYRLNIPIANSDGSRSVMAFDVDDWMYRLDEHRVFNRSTLNKLGVQLGEITLFFDKTASPEECLVSNGNPQ